LNGIRREGKKRGLTQCLSLWNWFNTTLLGVVVRASVAVTRFDQAENPFWVWKLQNDCAVGMSLL
jgi:hypothetical protein